MKTITYYNDHAHVLFERYQSVPFEEVHAPWLSLLPKVPGLALDVGALTMLQARERRRRRFSPASPRIVPRNGLRRRVLSGLGHRPNAREAAQTAPLDPVAAVPDATI